MSALWEHLLIFQQRHRQFVIVFRTIVSLKCASVPVRNIEIRVHFLQRVQCFKEHFLISDLFPPQAQRLGLRRQHDIHQQELLCEIPVDHLRDFLKAIKLVCKFSDEVGQLAEEPRLKRIRKFHNGNQPPFFTDFVKNETEEVPLFLWREGGRERGREGGKERGREGGREGGRILECGRCGYVPLCRLSSGERSMR